MSNSQTQALESIDNALASYYHRFGVGYFDTNSTHMGVFMKYIYVEKLDDVDIPIEDELGDQSHPENCVYTGINEITDIPIPVGVDLPEAAKERFIYYLLQYCYKYEQCPSDQEIKEIILLKCGGSVIKPNRVKSKESVQIKPFHVSPHNNKYLTHQGTHDTQDTQPIQFAPKFSNHAKSNFYISPDKISEMIQICKERFDTNECSDERLAFGYLRQSIAMQINDKQIRVLQTWLGNIIIIDIDLHFKDSDYTMYLIAMENDIEYRNQAQWQIVSFMCVDEMYNVYGINKSDLPKSSRKMSYFKHGLSIAPVNVDVSVIYNTNFATLPGKKSRRSTKNEKKYANISESSLKRYCEQSWNNGLMIPCVVIKGKKQWIEWKKFVRIYDGFDQEQWIGISIRYYSSEKQWKIQCLDYDAGRVYYQHQLVGMDNIEDKYKIEYQKLQSLVTVSLSVHADSMNGMETDFFVWKDVKQICDEENGNIQKIIYDHNKSKENDPNNNVVTYPTTPPTTNTEIINSNCNNSNQQSSKQNNDPNNSHSYNGNGNEEKGDGNDDEDDKGNDKHTHELHEACKNPQCLKIMYQQQMKIEQLRKENENLRQMNKTLQIDQSKLLVLCHTAMQSASENQSNPPKNNKHRKNRKKKKKKKIKAVQQQICVDTDNMLKTSYEPLSSIRAKGNIHIPKTMTTEIIPSVADSKKKLNYYKFMDKRVAMELTDNSNIVEKLKTNLTNSNIENDMFLIDSGFITDEKKEESLYCIVKKQSNERNINIDIKWKMFDRLFTVTEVKDWIKNTCTISIPVSSRNRIDNLLTRIDDIKNLLNVSYEQIMNIEWCNVVVFNRKFTKRRIVLRAEKGHFRKFIHDFNSKISANNQIIMPIVMFNKVTYVIEWVLIVPITDNICIAISFEYNENRSVPLKISGLHLDKDLLLEQHYLVSAQHMIECNCLDHWKSCITNIEICDDLNADNNAIVDIKQKYQSLKTFMYQLIDENHAHNYETLKYHARLLIEYHNGYQPNFLTSEPSSSHSESNTSSSPLHGIEYNDNSCKSFSTSDSYSLQWV